MTINQTFPNEENKINLTHFFLKIDWFMFSEVDIFCKDIMNIICFNLGINDLIFVKTLDITIVQEYPLIFWPSDNICK